MKKQHCIIHFQTIILTCFFIFILLISQSSAQTPPHWRYWLAGNGLGESCSTSVHVGAFGNVWVNHGHIDQMSVLDGYTVLNIPSPGVSAPVYENPAGNIWSIYAGGLQKYSNAAVPAAIEKELVDNQSTEKMRAGSPRSDQESRWIRYPIEEISSIEIPFFPLTENQIVYCLPNRILSFTPETNTIELIKHVDETQLGQFNDIASAGNNTIWIAGTNGLAHYQPETETPWQEYPVNFSPPAYELTNIIVRSENEIYCIANTIEPTAGRVVLQFLDKQWQVLFPSPDSTIQWAWRGIQEQFWWIYSPLKIVFSEQDTEKTIDKNKVLSRVLLGLDIEPSGAFWLATSEGLARYSPATWDTPSPVSHLDMVIHDIEKDETERVWFLFKNRLACLYNNQWTFYPLPYGQQSDELLSESICILPNNRLVLKTVETVFLFDASTGEYQELHHPDHYEIDLIAPSENGKVLLFSTNDQHFRIDVFNGNAFTRLLEHPLQPFTGSQLRQMVAGQNGTFWFAGLDGITRYQNGIVKNIGQEDGFTDTAAFCIQFIGNQRMWVGGREAIHEYDGQFWKLIRSGLDGVRAILKHSDGSIWVASGTGLHRYENGSWISNTSEEGLPDAAIYEIYEDHAGRLWAGTTSGLSLYHPNADQDAPETWIPDETNSHEIAPGGAQFYFQGRDKWNYTRAESLLYSWRFDQNHWSPFHPQTVVPTSKLTPGPHTFEVKAMDHNWNIDPSPAIHHFTVLRAWYQEPLLIVILTLGSMILLFSLSLHIAHHKNLGKLVMERTTDLSKANIQLHEDAKELQSAYDQVLSYQNQLQLLASELSLVEERERRRLAADLHDSIGQTLALSMIKLEGLQAALESHKQTEEVEKIKTLIEQTLHNSRSLTLELCPPILYEVGLNAAIEQLVDQIQTQYGLSIQTEMNIPENQLPEDLLYFLFRTIRELLTNIGKHAKASRAHLRVQQTETGIHLQVQDDGKGFDPEMQPMKTTGFGLFSIRERLHQIGGTFTISSKPNEGTCIDIGIPLE